MTIQQVFAKHSNLTSLSDGDYEHMMDEEDFTNAAKELIEYHVKAALLQASESARTDNSCEVWNCPGEIVKRDSILNSYPLNLIK